MANPKPSGLFVMVLSTIWAYIVASINKTAVDFSTAAGLPHSKITYDLSPRPGLCVTLPQKSGENKVRALETAGFVKRSNGRYNYFVGPASEAAIMAAVKEGAESDAYAPGELVSINGLALFLSMSRILHYAFSILHTIEIPDSATSFSKIPATGSDSDSFKLHEGNLKEVPKKGFFFGYFDGLLLPDHGHTLSAYIARFSPLFGSQPAGIAEAIKTFGSGWSTLQATIAGREYSHMIFCLELAFSAGIRARPLFLSGRYSGCVFETSTAICNVGGALYVPQDTEGLTAGIQRMQCHESALAEVCALLAEIPTDDSEIVELVSPSRIKTARQLHNLFRTRTLGPDLQTKIIPLLKKMRFEQSLWDVTNAKHVAAVIALIVEKKFPDESVPMNIRIDAMFTKQPIYSALGAFGLKAPSIRGSGTLIVRRIAPKFYENIDKPGRLVGVPIFAKSHQEAKEDWEGVLNEYTVFFDHKSKDKEGKLRIKNVTAFIPFDTDEYRDINNRLGSLVKGKKREREEEETVAPTQEQLDLEDKKKRRRIKGIGMLGLTFGLPSSDATMDVDDEDDIYA